MLKVIGINGRYRHGKDTVASILINERGFTKINIGAPLYEMLYRLNPPITLTVMPKIESVQGTNVIRVSNGADIKTLRVQDIVDSIGWDQAKDYYPEIRALLQRMGHEMRSVMWDSLWIDKWWRTVRESGATKVVVPDVRYDVDAHKILQVRGQVWHIDRPDYRTPDEVNAKHAGERGIDPKFISTRLVNREGQLEDLRTAVLMAADGISW